MTLKNKTGSWSLTRLALLFTILGGIAMIVEAAPTFFSYCGKVVAPWNELPTLNANIEELKSDVKAIKHHLRIGIEDYKSADLTNTVQEATLTRK
jgi:hypothetical protein